MNKLNLTKEDILKKVFIPSSKGYSPKEVDDFLDKIIDDYDTFEKIILELRSEIAHLKDGDKKFKRDKRHHDSDVLPSEKQETLDNLYLLRRCSILEKKLYDLGVDPSKIK